MTLNDLKTIFNSDDLNPNTELIFSTALSKYDEIDVDDEHVIDDVAERDDKIIIYLKGKNDS